METAIDVVLAANGIYDIACAFSILWLHPLPGFKTLSALHPAMFAAEEHSNNPVIQRLLAYWLMTYGLTRTAAGFHRDSVLDTIAALTYFIEAFCFEYESRVGKTLVPFKATFVSVFSTLLGCWVILRPFRYY